MRCQLVGASFATSVAHHLSRQTHCLLDFFLLFIRGGVAMGGGSMGKRMGGGLRSSNLLLRLGGGAMGGGAMGKRMCYDQAISTCLN